MVSSRLWSVVTLFCLALVATPYITGQTATISSSTKLIVVTASDWHAVDGILLHRANNRRAYADDSASPTATIRRLTSTVLQKMKESGSLKPNCPVKARDLRLVKVPYLDFEGRSQIGQLVVNRTLAKEVGSIFVEIYRIRFPIDKIRIIDEYGASDDAAMADDNTSAFNCRELTGRPGVYSPHSCGIAIDINPFLNPYIRPKDDVLFKQYLQALAGHDSTSDALNAFCLENSEHCVVLPETAKKYITRNPANIGLPKSLGIVLRGSRVYDIFVKRGWRWGGDWPEGVVDRIRSDYQHFEKPLRDKSGSVTTCRLKIFK
jgi:hypothetical protein